MKRAGWERLSEPGKKTSAHWAHESGWAVFHCGHPTANWPYYATEPNNPGAMVVTHNGLGFRTLEDAFSDIEAVLTDRAEVRDGPDGDAVRRIYLKETP